MGSSPLFLSDLMDFAYMSRSGKLLIAAGDFN